MRSVGDRIAGPGEELANTITHAVGLVLSLIGTPVLIAAALSRGETLAVVGAATFGGALIMLYAASTLYHLVKHPETKQRLRMLDHFAIYVLIAGTYTPFTFGVLRGAWGWTMFGIVWTLAVIGVVGKLRFRFANERASTALYVVMGWVAIIALRPMVKNMEWPGLFLLLAGGVMYTGGVLFYRQRRTWSHPVWHLFVMAGSACHYFAVLWYSSPRMPG